MGFDGRCKGGGLGEVWASQRRRAPDVRVRDGRFAPTLTGTVRNLGGVEGRTGELQLAAHAAASPSATSPPRPSPAAPRSASAGKIISRCKIAEPAVRAARDPLRLLTGAKFLASCPYRGMPDDPATLLLVEDDPVVRTFLADNLTADGYELLRRRRRRATRCAMLEYARPDLAVVDLELPDGSGLDLIRRVRAADGVGVAAGPDAAAGDPVRLAPASSTASAGFERGADDYVSKPFAYGELRLRIAAVLRRTRARVHRGLLRVGALEIDPAGACHDVARAAGRARGEGVRAAADARLGADARVHEGGAAARRLGLQGARARRARWTRTPAGCARSCACTGDEFVVNVWGVGYRLVDGPADERGRSRDRRAAELGGDGGAGRVHLRAHRRLVLVARASHELRGPLCAVQLGLHGLAGEPARVGGDRARAAARRPRARRPRRGTRRRARRDARASSSTSPRSSSPTRPRGRRWPRVRRGAARRAATDRHPLRRRARGRVVRRPRRRRPAAQADHGTLAPATVFADPLRIAQACANLVGNAAEHGGGVVRVRVRATGDHVRIEVADDGPGLPATRRRAHRLGPRPPRPPRPRPRDRGGDRRAPRRRGSPRRHAVRERRAAADAVG